MAASVVSDVCKALMGLHAFIGCDTFSTFAGKGKTRALTILNANAEFKAGFAQWGSVNKDEEVEVLVLVVLTDMLLLRFLPYVLIGMLF